MKKIILLIIVLATLVFPTSFLVIAYEENKSIDGPELQIGIFGASLAGGLRRTGFIIYNKGDEPILDIQYVFSIKDNKNNEINYSYSKEIEPLKFNSAYQFVTNKVHGFGMVTLSLSVSSSNAGDKNLSISAFQIGPYTISKPWIFSWYNFR
jgi:hypothetical protein